VPGPTVHCLTNGVFQENCYILADPDTRDAVLVDPGEEAELFLARLGSEGLQLRAVWLTHAHLDHIIGVGEVVARNRVPVYLHADDRPLYDGVEDQARWLGVTADALPPPDEDLAELDAVEVGSLRFDVRHVPGHSPGSVAFVGHGMALVGDLVFLGSVGRADLAGGDAGTLIRSIQEHVLMLPDDTVLYPGHGPATSVGRERRANPFLTGQFRLV
jgi:hydroxyacylglutathione hydrolase